MLNPKPWQEMSAEEKADRLKSQLENLERRVTNMGNNFESAAARQSPPGLAAETSASEASLPALLRQARASLGENNPADVELILTIDRWLASHPNARG